jgi:hypothetical protein
LFDWGGGGVSVSVREEGKSEFWGVRVGILDRSIRVECIQGE